MNWIKTCEQKPIPDIRVLVKDKDNYVTIAERVALYDQDEYWVNVHSIIIPIEDYIYWMKLPE